jgi:hypothetical protein
MTIESDRLSSPEPLDDLENPMHGETPEKDLFALIAKIENLPRSQQRTIVRELIDRLGQESIASLLD